MARPRKEQPAPVVEPAESTEPVEQPAPVVELHTPESLGYAPGEVIPLHHLNLIGKPIQ